MRAIRGAIPLIGLLLGLAASAQAGGDPAAGERAVVKCKACHAVTAPDGTAILKGGRTGPDLYAVVGRRAASIEGFRYSPSLRAAGESGLVWDEATLVAYLGDPTKFLRDHLGDPAARGAMTFRLTRGSEDIVAWLASIAAAR